MAALAFVAEGPALLPTVKSALVRPTSPPPPIVQTHRTEDIELPAPAPRSARPRRPR
jgi:hypothetical protein